MGIVTDWYDRDRDDEEEEPKGVGVSPRNTDRFKEIFHTKGKPAEKLALSYVHEYIDKDAYRTEGKDYDIVCPNFNNFTYEIKNQEHAKKYVVIEIERRSNPAYPYQPSGISTTKAQAYGIYCHEKVYVIPTAKIKELIKYQDARNSSLDGDYAKTHVKLIAIETLEQEAVAQWD